MRVLGIDPGKTGAFAICDNGHLTLVETFPMVGGELSFMRLAKRFQQLSSGIDSALLERVHAIPGASARSTFQFGQNFQIVLDALAYAEIQVALIKPLVWQRPVFNGEPVVYRISKKTKEVMKSKDTKKMALRVANRLWPKENFHTGPKATTAHDGMVDAALIAYYGSLLRKE